MYNIFYIRVMRGIVHARAGVATVGHGIGYVKARLMEPSTWLLFSAAIGSASVLPAPYSYMSLFCGVVAGMIPNQKAS